jgi:hypothetical protein
MILRKTMLDPLKRFDWDNLYEEYDKRCKRFDPGSIYLECLGKKPESDRELYSILISRVASEFRQFRTISLRSYRSILYWKLYSHPAAVENSLKPFTKQGERSRIESALRELKSYFHKTMRRNLNDIVTLIRNMRELKLHGTIAYAAWPVRSTLLHFLYPDIVPVLDQKVLRAVGVYEESANRRLPYFEQYIEHAWHLENKYKSILNEKREYSNIRLIDMALWVEGEEQGKKAGKCIKNDY